MKTCAFTGHRPQHLPFGMNENDERCVKLKEELKEQIINLIEAEDVTHFITGMALGVDLYAAEIVLDLKARYPSITLESAIPCETQAVKWSMAQRERYYDIAAQCDKETMLQSHYSPDCMDKRNRYMVDHADFIIAVWDGRSSGTGKTVQYALFDCLARIFYFTKLRGSTMSRPLLCVSLSFHHYPSNSNTLYCTKRGYAD